MNTYRANLIIGVGGLETNARYKKILCVCVQGAAQSAVCSRSVIFFGDFLKQRSQLRRRSKGRSGGATGLCFYTQLNNLGRNLLVFEKKPRGFYLLRNANLRKQIAFEACLKKTQMTSDF